MSEKAKVLSEFWVFLKEEKKWWLGPIVAVMLGLGLVLVVTQNSAIMPFVYSLF